MLFKKKKEGPTEQPDEVKTQLQETLTRLVAASNRIKDLEKQLEEARGGAKARDTEITELRGKIDELRRVLEKSRAAAAATPPDPFGIPKEAEMGTLALLLGKIEARANEVRGLIQSRQQDEAASAAGKRGAQLLKRLGDVDSLFAREVDVLRKDLQRAGNDLKMIEGVAVAVSDLESREDGKRQELLEKLKNWKAAGIVVTKVETISAGTLADLDREFVLFEKEVVRAQGLTPRIGRLEDTAAAESLRERLRDPATLAEVEERLTGLERAAAERARTTAGPTPAPAAPAPGTTPGPAPHTGPPAAAGGGDEVEAMIARAEEMLERARKAGKDVNTPTNLLRLAKSFARSKNEEKARQYAERASKIAETALQ